MSDVTRLRAAIEHGDARAGAELLPLVSQELRQLAALLAECGAPASNETW